MSIVKSIRIQNFKSLEDVTVDLSQLTLLFGANSSGKSSFLKALMFLSKNLNTDEYTKVKYSISEDVDLGSANEVAPSGDRNKDWIFEITLDGFVEFPSIELFETSAQLKHQTLGDFFKYEVKELLKDKETRSKNFSLERVSATYSVSFGEIIYSDPAESEPLPLDNKFLKKILVKENQSDSEYSFLRNQTVEDPNHPNGLYYILDKEQAIIPQFRELSTLFNRYFGQKYLRSLFELGDYNIVQDNNINNFPTLRSLLSIDFKLIDVDENESLESAIDIWHTLDIDKKIEFYYLYIRLFYLSLVAVPDEIRRLLTYFHLPTTRMVPKRVFLKKDNKFPITEYYGLLNFLSDESDHEYSELEMASKKLGKDLLDTLSIVCSPDSKTKSLAKSVSPFGRVGFFANTPFFVINYWILRLGFEYLYKMSSTEDIGKIQLVKNDGTISMLADASSGFIQLFPIIVKSCTLGENTGNGSKDVFEFTLKSGENYFASNPLEKGKHSTLLIEQPELHLHPKLQSELAVFFTNVISKIGTDYRLIIETHSEHLIRKIQVLIAKGELEREKVGVWYFKKVDGITKVEKMEIDENGLFKNDWPDGFFDDSIELTMELFEALRKRNN